MTKRIFETAGKNVDVDAIEAAITRGDYETVIGLAGGTCHGSVRGLWSAAMTVVYGPLRLHESYCDENGRPSVLALQTFPHIVHMIDEAKQTVANHMAQLVRGATVIA